MARNSAGRNSVRRSDTGRARRRKINVAKKRPIHRLQEYGYNVQGPMFPDSAGREYYQVDLNGIHIATLGTHSTTPNTLYVNQIYTENDTRPGRPHASDIYMGFWYRTILQNGRHHAPLRRFIFENVEEDCLETVVKTIHREARCFHADPIWKTQREHTYFSMIEQTRLPKSVAWMLQDYRNGAEMCGMHLRSCEIQLLSRIRSGNPPEFNLCIEIG